MTVAVTFPDGSAAEAFESMVPLTAAEAIARTSDLEAAIVGLADDDGRLRVSSPVVAAQAYRNAQARRDLAAEFPLWSGAEVAHAASSSAKNPHATASRWRAQGRVFAVPGGAAQLYPSFQFDEGGRPWPVVSEVLAVLRPVLAGWPLALWFVTPTSFLDELRPVDVLGSDGPVDHARLLASARAQAADVGQPAW